ATGRHKQQCLVASCSTLRRKCATILPSPPHFEGKNSCGGVNFRAAAAATICLQTIIPVGRSTPAAWGTESVPVCAPVHCTAPLDTDDRLPPPSDARTAHSGRCDPGSRCHLHTGQRGGAPH